VNQQLFKSTAIVSGFTFLSRMLGFIRDLLIGQIFGVNANTDAFLIAFKIPNFFRRLFAEGAFAQAFIPILTDYQQHNPQQLKAFINAMAGYLVLCLLILAGLGVVGAAGFIHIFAPGWDWQGLSTELAIKMLQITFPYILFISLVAFSAAILNIHGQFAIPAITPIWLNISLITAAVIFAPLFSHSIIVLAWGVLFAGVIQCLFQFPALIQLKLLPKPSFDLSNSGVKRVIQLMLPALFGASLIQINLMINSLLATFLPSGSVSWLYYSDRLVEFPLGIFGIALATVILPKLSQQYLSTTTESFTAILNWGLNLTLLIAIPAALGLYFLAKPLLATLFQYRQFSEYDVIMASKSLQAYSLGLVAFMLSKILIAAFSATQDTKTPVRFNIYAIISNLIFNLILMQSLAHQGLALATSLAAWINTVLLWQRLYRLGYYQWQRNNGILWLQICFANAIMIMSLMIMNTENWQQWTAIQRGQQLLIEIIIAIVVYISSLWISGIRLKDLLLKV
jgi:putative peptidoglycan lipid II flippase